MGQVERRAGAAQLGRGCKQEQEQQVSEKPENPMPGAVGPFRLFGSWHLLERGERNAWPKLTCTRAAAYLASGSSDVEQGGRSCSACLVHVRFAPTRPIASSISRTREPRS